MTTPRESRRDFLKKTAAAAFIAAADFTLPAAETTEKAHTPWYRRALRWGQTNITEMDVQHYDIAWWRQHWQRTQTHAVIINAGGIVAYYPSKFPLHHRAQWLGDRDLFGELAAAARSDGIIVVARMDSNRTHEDFFRAHPDWFARDPSGEPYRNTDFYVTCVNSPYYDAYLPSVLREIIERSHPDGFADNNWNGLDRESICYCDNCQRKFRDASGQAIPRVKNWDDPTWRAWLQWNYRRRLEIWDQFNRVTREAGGADCLWIGMNSGSISAQAQRFRDFKGICERSEILLLDEQSRNDTTGFQHNGELGKLAHGLLGWEKLMPESMAMYQAGRPTFRLSAKPANEARLWMLDGFAGGIQPWWHHVGAYQEDRRAFETAAPVLRWHAENHQYLINRRPVANIGLVWSQQNADFFGRDNADALVESPWRGWTNALVRARIAYLPVHADHITRDMGQFSVLILPNLAALSEEQITAIRQFAARGGSLVATGETSRRNEFGEPQPDFALADLLGAHLIDGKFPDESLSRRGTASDTLHSYLRLAPSTVARVYGPNAGNEPTPGQRHPILAGFDETDILPFGGRLEPMRVDKTATVLATFVPPFPVSPPEKVFMSQSSTDIPGIVVNEIGNGSRIVYLSADLDRRYDRDNLPDHANLLANAVRWAAHDEMPLRVRGAGFVDCHLYEQSGKHILHLVNLTNSGTWRAPVDELISVGPLHVTLRTTSTEGHITARLLVSKAPVKCSTKNSFVEFDIPTVLDHEVVVVG